MEPAVVVAWVIGSLHLVAPRVDIRAIDVSVLPLLLLFLLLLLRGDGFSHLGVEELQDLLGLVQDEGAEFGQLVDHLSDLGNSNHVVIATSIPIITQSIIS